MAAARPVFLFAHGAGAGKDSTWMKHWAQLLGDIGYVHAFDYPYMQMGKKMPDRLPKLIEAHNEELKKLQAKHSKKKIFLIGKSMGSRVGCHLSADLAEKGSASAIAGVICLGYPLVGIGGTKKGLTVANLHTAPAAASQSAASSADTSASGSRGQKGSKKRVTEDAEDDDPKPKAKRGKASEKSESKASNDIRDEVLYRMQHSVLFVSGDRDNLNPLNLFRAVVSRMSAPTELKVILGGDHSCAVTKKHSGGKTQKEVDAEILAAIREFVESK